MPSTKRLIDGVLESEVFLFDVPVLVGDAKIVGRGLQVVVRHQEPIALLGLGTPGCTERVDRRAEMIGAVLTRYTAYLPQAGFEAFNQARLDWDEKFLADLS